MGFEVFWDLVFCVYPIGVVEIGIDVVVDLGLLRLGLEFPKVRFRTDSFETSWMAIRINCPNEIKGLFIFHTYKQLSWVDLIVIVKLDPYIVLLDEVLNRIKPVNEFDTEVQS